MMHAPLPRKRASESSLFFFTGACRGLTLVRGVFPPAGEAAGVSAAATVCADSPRIGKPDAGVTFTKWTGMAGGTGSGAGCMIAANEYFPCSP